MKDPSQVKLFSEITKVLATFKACVTQGNFRVSVNENRQENRDFAADYRLTEKARKDLLLRIQITDFCYKAPNTNSKFPSGSVYIFCPTLKLLNFNALEEAVEMYVKFTIQKTVRGEQVVVISLHKRNRPEKYPFR